MTIQKLYQNIDGDYDQAIHVLRIDKLIDKHIRRFAQNSVAEELFSAGESMDPAELFEAAHALKGLTANLGLMKLSEVASEITEEYRPGNVRQLSDDEVKERIELVRELYDHTVAGIRRYEEESE